VTEPTFERGPGRTGRVLSAVAAAVISVAILVLGVTAFNSHTGAAKKRIQEVACAGAPENAPSATPTPTAVPVETALSTPAATPAQSEPAQSSPSPSPSPSPSLSPEATSTPSACPSPTANCVPATPASPSPLSTPATTTPTALQSACPAPTPAPHLTCSSNCLPNQPVGTFDTGSGNSPTAIAVDGNFAYVISECGDSCFSPFDVLGVADPSNPTLLGHSTISWSSRGIVVRGNRAYTTGFTANPNYVRVIDVTDPTKALTLNAFQGEFTSPLGIFVLGPYAYVTDYGGDKLDIVDIANPALIPPQDYYEGGPFPDLPLAGTVATGAGPSSVAVAGSYAYVLDARSNTLQVFDVSNPKAPSLVSATGLGRQAGQAVFSALDVVGSTVYIANDATNSLQVVDATDPANPVLSATVATGGGPQSIAVDGGYAFVAVRGDNGVQVFDVSGKQPVLKGTIATASAPDSVVVQGHDLFVADHDSHLVQIFDVGNLLG
jgi:hypothetical protein